MVKDRKFISIIRILDLTKLIISFSALSILFLSHNNLTKASDKIDIDGKRTDSSKKNYLDSYQKLPEVNTLRESTQIGKSDPFSSGKTNKDINTLNYIKLLGVYKTTAKKFALLEYNNQVGEVVEGSVGGIDTLLLPEKALLKEISVIKPLIIIDLNNKEYEIKL